MAGLRNSIEAENAPTRKGPGTPKGWKSSQEFLSDMRRRYEWGVGHNEHNVRAAKDDAKFTAGNQWDSLIKQRRDNDKKPTLTFNRLVAFVAQIVGNRLANETEIKVYPDKGGTKEIALLREGIIRNIFKNSNAKFARDEAQKYQVIGGEGSFTLKIDFASDDVFEKDINLQAIVDPYAAVYDPLSVEPSGGDGLWAFVGDDIPQQEYKKRWPWASATSFEDAKTWNKNGFWLTEDVVRIVSYWAMVTDGTKTLCLYRDGTVHDVTDKEEYEYLQYAETRDDGSLFTRVVPNRFAQLYVCSGNEILEGPFNYKVSSIPVYRVPGWELNDGERVHRWGLVRFLKDPQRLHNYWRSTVAEQLVAAPRNKWLTTPDAVKGHEAKWRKAPTATDPFLYYNDGESPPVHIPPPGIDAALINEAGLATQDLKDISNIHEASLGAPSNEVSKVAIQQRQGVSDIGTYIYTDRQANADERCAKNINELIPTIYDTRRLIVEWGSDDKIMTTLINDPTNPNSDVTLGKYGVTVSTGPSSATRRQAASEQMMSFVNAVPETADMVMDIVAGAQDWPAADQFAQRFKVMIASKFPGIIPPEEMTPQMQQAAAAAQAQAQAAQQLQTQTVTIENLLRQNKALEAEAGAALRRAQTYKAIVDANARKDDVDGKNDERSFKAASQLVDSHNSMIHEDRTHALDAISTLHGMHVDSRSADTADAGLDIQQQQADAAQTAAENPPAPAAGA